MAKRLTKKEIKDKTIEKRVTRLESKDTGVFDRRREVGAAGQSRQQRRHDDENTDVDRRQNRIADRAMDLGEDFRLPMHTELRKQDYSNAKSVALQKKSKIVVAAIDFGTTYSGYAFSFEHEFAENPLTMHANEWKNVAQGQLNVKTPTCLLLNPDKTIHSFGAEAKAKYMSLSEMNEHGAWYFFWEFKMTLHQEKEITENYMLKEENGKTLDALTVFSLSIQFMKDHMMSVLKNSFDGVDKGDLLWVITVPAIWNDSAKKFMRQAAKKAGIDEDSLEIALEPEAASIYCRQLPITRDPETPAGMTKFPTGTRYMLLDCGGGTVDVTIHEVMEDNNLKELHKATGGHWGGTVVNKAFLSFLSSLVGAEVFDEFKRVHKADYMELREEFENKKRMAKPDSTDVVTVKIPIGLQKLFGSIAEQPLNEQAIRSQYKDKVHLLGDKLRIDAKLFESFFDSAVRDIIAHVHDLLESLPHPVKAILMVGGFSESPVLQKAIKSAFPKERIEKGVIVSVDASLCVMKGAVLYGHRPSKITERVCRYTYGLGMMRPFKKKIDPLERMVEIEGVKYCNDLFDKHVEIGQIVECGKAQAMRVYQAMSAKDTVFPIVVYRSTDKNPRFVDDKNYVGCFMLDRTPSEETRRGSGVINVRFVFGNSDIVVEAIKEDGSVHKLDFKFE